MERYPHESPSVAWASVRDVSDTEALTADADEPSLVAREHLFPGRRRIESAVAAALSELQPHSRRLAVTVDDPDNTELARAQALVAGRRITAAEASERLGAPVTDLELVGWISQWSLQVRVLDSVAETSVTPIIDAAELAIELADWLQTFLADGGVSDPNPPCPGHSHPMLPVVHEGAPWWECPMGDLVRPWPTPSSR